MIRFIANRWVHFTLLSGLVLVLSIFSQVENSFRFELQSVYFDEMNKNHPREKSGEVIIVDIDNESLKRIGQWPWPRAKLASVVESLTSLGAKSITYDGVIAEPDQTSPDIFAKNLPKDSKYDPLRSQLLKLEKHDEILARAIQESGIFVTGFTHGSKKPTDRLPEIKTVVGMHFSNKVDLRSFQLQTPDFTEAATFLPALEKLAAGNGSYIAAPDKDGVLRKTGLIFSNNYTPITNSFEKTQDDVQKMKRKARPRLFPALSLEALRVAEGGGSSFIKIRESDPENKTLFSLSHTMVLGDKYKVPIEPGGRLYVYYRKFIEDGDDYISAYKILSKSHRDEAGGLVKDKIVFIGSSAEGLKDLRSTAIEAFQPGVEVHANVAEQILQGKYLQRPLLASTVEGIFILCIGVLLVLLAPFVNVIATGLISFGLIGAAFSTSYLGYINHGYLIDPVYPSLCIFLIFVASTILTYLRTEFERGQIRDAFGLYISPEYMKDLTENPEKLKLGGENRDLSVMFTDIRNFTSISEGLTPQELIQLMNDFLTPMSDLVMQNKGTIDKYMGDAMMAFWNAPLEDADHARHACLTALGMQAELEPINEQVRVKAEELGKEPVLLKAGIGINSGECAVGNMGSKQRFAYSTLGDAVNVASRLEGQTKAYGVGILIGEKTWQQVPEMACIEADLITVKGKTRPERIFVLIGDATLKEKVDFKKLLSAHEDMIKNYRAASFKEAQSSLKSCIKLDNFGLDTLYKLYEERIKAMLKTPPPKDWDGVYTAETK